MKGKLVDFKSLAEAFNEYVIKAGPHSKALRFKLASHLEDYAKKIHERQQSSDQLEPQKEYLIKLRELFELVQVLYL